MTTCRACLYTPKCTLVGIRADTERERARRRSRVGPVKRVAEDEQGKKKQNAHACGCTEKKKHQVAARLTFSFPQRQKRGTSAVHTLFHVSDLLRLKKTLRASVHICAGVAQRSGLPPFSHADGEGQEKEKKNVTIVLKHLGSFLSSCFNYLTTIAFSIIWSSVRRAQFTVKL